VDTRWPHGRIFYVRMRLFPATAVSSFHTGHMEFVYLYFYVKDRKGEEGGGSVLYFVKDYRLEPASCTTKDEPGEISNYIFFLQHSFYRDTLYINYLLHVSAFRSSSGTHIRCWLHCSPLALASVYSGYVLCCLSDILRYTATMYFLAKMLSSNLKIVMFNILAET
jgi:hypothetical protein